MCHCDWGGRCGIDGTRCMHLMPDAVGSFCGLIMLPPPWVISHHLHSCSCFIPHQMPWPDVHPLPMAAPTPTSRPPIAALARNESGMKLKASGISCARGMDARVMPDRSMMRHMARSPLMSPLMAPEMPADTTTCWQRQTRLPCRQWQPPSVSFSACYMCGAGCSC